MSQNDEGVKSDMEQILSRVANIENIQSYDTRIDTSVLSGDGFFGDILFGSIEDKTSKIAVNIAVKKAYNSKSYNGGVDLAEIYRVENYFYDEIFPTLDKFQSDLANKHLFTSIPRYYFGINEPSKEAVVMEDLNADGYQLIKNTNTLDEDHMSFIFNEYAKLHAISLSFKDQMPEEYLKITLEIDKNHMLDSPDLKYGINILLKKLCLNFNPSDGSKFSARLKEYSSDAFKQFKDAYLYKGPYSTIIHGNARLNNIMFKYNDNGKLKSIKIIDFQTVKLGSPVHDLSYIFYGGASKEVLEKLDNLLDEYYITFSSVATQLGSSAEKIYPKTAFKEEWTKCAKCGFLMGLVHAKIQNFDRTVIADGFLSKENNTEDKYNKLLKERQTSTSVPDEHFVKTARNLLKHAAKHDVL